MRQFHTVVLERLRPVAEDFDTEPYEAGWASEAIFFVRVQEPAAGASLIGVVQISVDGITWVDEGSRLTVEDGTAFVRVAHFGGWLRLRNTVTGPMTVTLQLVLKE